MFLLCCLPVLATCGCSCILPEAQLPLSSPSARVPVLTGLLTVFPPLVSRGPGGGNSFSPLLVSLLYQTLCIPSAHAGNSVRSSRFIKVFALPFIYNTLKKIFIINYKIFFTIL